MKAGRKDFGSFLGRQDSRRLSEGWKGSVKETLEECGKQSRKRKGRKGMGRTDGLFGMWLMVRKWDGMFGMQLTVWERKKGVEV